jgi:DNA-binding transcriptional MerR regulator
MPKDKGIAQAAHDAGCSEGGLRRLERKGIVHPVRDPWGRRLFGEDDIEAARRYLAEQAAARSQGAELRA